ncbi:hypothetical protein V1511DRAFT_491625 [Dipodascopsis uninucleata]
MASTRNSVLQVFDKIPPLLSRFFKKYPPQPLVSYSSKITSTDAPDRNPFLPARHPVTKKLHDPAVSLRRQSDLFKLAREYGLENLLPPLTKRFGLEKFTAKPVMKGVKAPKGAKHERTAKERLEIREAAIANADEIILKAKGKRYRRILERKKLPPKNLF